MAPHPSFRCSPRRTALAGFMALATVAATVALGAAAPASAAPATAVAQAAPAGHAIPDGQYSVMGFDSQSAPYPAPPSLDGTAAGAFDGDYSTQWASGYTTSPDPMPHWLTFDTGSEYSLTGIGYSVKVQGNGPAANVEVFATNDPDVAKDGASSSWGSPVGTATFTQPTSNSEIQYVDFTRPVEARYLKFEVLSAVNGSANASASEIVAYTTDPVVAPPAGHVIPNSQYKIVGEDSEATTSGDGSAASALDGDYTTQWTSQLSPSLEPFPHWLTFDVGGSFTLTGLGYSVKDQYNGPIRDAKVYVTDDPVAAKDPNSSSWQPAGSATFTQPAPQQQQGAASTEVQYVTFSTPIKAEFVKFEGLDAINGSAIASASDLVVYSTDKVTTPPVTTPPVTPPTQSSPYTVTTDSVDANGWKYPDDTPASLYTDKDGTFYFGESHADYGSEPDGSDGNLRQWGFYTGTNMDTAAPDAALNQTGTNPDTSQLCSTGPTGKSATSMPQPSGNKYPDYCDLTQIWVDPDTGDWYGLVHNEFTLQPFGDGIHYDAIDYARSSDQGKTWTIVDHAITSPYSTTRGDTAAFPEQTYYYGDGDPRLYVDYASGYFYAFYGSRVVNKGGIWAAFYEHVARAPISEKMAAGSWEKWYDGAWDQPGIGGKESNMTPVTTADPTGYTAPGKEYNPKTPGTAQQQIANGQMPATSPLFVMDVTYDAYLGLYIGEPQNPDQSGKAPQEFYATKSLATQKWFKLGDTGSAYTTASWYRWFLDPANKTSDAIVGKSFRSYCTGVCVKGAYAEYANVTISTQAPAKPAVDTGKQYTIASGGRQVLSTSADGASVISTAQTDPTSAWTFAPTGDGAYTIADSHGALLGVDSSTTASRAWGAGLTLTPADAATVGQQWFVVPNTNPDTGEATGSVRLVNRYSGLVLGMTGGADAKAGTTPGRTWDASGATTNTRSTRALAATSVDAFSTPADQTITLAVYNASGTNPGGTGTTPGGTGTGGTPTTSGNSASGQQNTASTLATTGSDLLAPGIAATILLLLGAALVVLRRRRRHG
ncbi:discoidin domain-containing protein [Humibacter antri]